MQLHLNQVAKVIFMEGHASTRNITLKVYSISSLGAPHAIFFLLQQLCILQNAHSQPGYCSLPSQKGVMDIFRLVSSLLLRSLRLKLGMPLSPVNPESIKSPSFWQHAVPGMKSTTGSSPTNTRVSEEAACAQSTQLYSSLDSNL